MNEVNKEEKIIQIMRAYKELDLKLNLNEIALLSEVSERYVHLYNIKDLWTSSGMAYDEDFQAIFESSIKVGLLRTRSIDEMLGVILGTYLRIESYIFTNTQGFRDAWKVGEAVVKLYKQTCSYKNKPVPIHSSNANSKFISRKLKKSVDKLFERTRSYKKEMFSKKWQPTLFLKSTMNRSISIFLDYLLLNTKRLKPHMFLQNTANGIRYAHFSVKTIKDFHYNSIFNVLMSTTEIKDDKFKVAIQNESSGDEALGRTYNVFCKLRSAERLMLGYISYDMNAALQSISLQLIGAVEKDYPFLWKYTNDKEYKKHIRAEIAKDLGIGVDRVKAKLTAFANGSYRDRDRHN